MATGGRRSRLADLPDPETRVIGGYLAAVAVADTWLTACTAASGLVSGGRVSAMAVAGAWLGVAFLATLFALPGFLATFVFAFVARIRSLAYFAIAGGIGGLGLSMLVVQRPTGIAESLSLAGALPLSAGMLGGATFWSIAGRHLGPSPDARLLQEPPS
ncbi:hypothetical protein [Methylobacterium trifolii]|uniref:Uncharacterized protein n=1 Tax=Methylobacterium trifolii TaxID=1003092 RepID=A0ABQ4U1N1_9HYPH|nr:hypothetical protein [Methylobacterium trifolii]GJE61366.1 hypothetical protein MPOCJGCO_3488 [Methylobacterium trifolii]